MPKEAKGGLDRQQKLLVPAAAAAATDTKPMPRATWDRVRNAPMSTNATCKDLTAANHPILSLSKTFTLHLLVNAPYYTKFLLLK